MKFIFSAFKLQFQRTNNESNFPISISELHKWSIFFNLKYSERKLKNVNPEKVCIKIEIFPAFYILERDLRRELSVNILRCK
jgi:hypothetical protein